MPKQGRIQRSTGRWFPDSGCLPIDRLCFEHYTPQKKEDDHTRRVVEIFIPITPPQERWISGENN